MKPLRKKSLSIGADTHRKIAIASAETGRDMYELIDEAWQVYTGKLAAQTKPPSGTASADVIELTEDQRDTLAMLAEDEDRDSLFSFVQATVKHALGQYRKHWKPKTTGAAHPKAARKGHLPERRSTGT